MLRSKCVELLCEFRNHRLCRGSVLLLHQAKHGHHGTLHATGHRKRKRELNPGSSSLFRRITRPRAKDGARHTPSPLTAVTPRAKDGAQHTPGA